ncbi:MAG: MFS transporter [Actinomycetota bacterium]|nr:MFS transporter [Actinomycetota bacterium]
MARSSASLRPRAEPSPPAATRAAAPRGAHWQLTVACLGVLLAAADTYVVVLALPDIMAGVGISSDHLQQATPILSVFLLGYVVLLPLIGRLSDVYGRIPVLVYCLATFAVGSALTAAAHGLPLLVVGRGLQGLGGGGLVPVTLAMVADGWPTERRSLPLGIVGAVQELGSVVGPLYGAGVVALAGWRAIFWLNLGLAAVLGAVFAAGGRAAGRHPVAGGPGGASGAGARSRFDVLGGGLLVLGAVAALLALVAPPALADDVTLGALYEPLLGSLGALGTPIALASACLLAGFVGRQLLAPADVRRILPLAALPSVVRTVDLPGALLLAGALGGVILAFASADPSRQVLAPGGLGVLVATLGLAAAFVLRERRARLPLIPGAALADRAAYGALLTSFALGAALMAALVDIPIFARVTRYPDSQVGAALVLVRFLLALPVGAVVGGLASRRVPHRLVAAAGLALSTAMFLVLARWPSSTLFAHPVASGATLALCGFGFGLAVAPVNAAILAAVRPALHGLASALVVVARTVGMLVGLSLLTAVGLRQLYQATARIPAPSVLCPSRPGSCPAYNAALKAAALTELHTVFYGAAVCAGVAALLALVLLRRLREPSRPA